MHYTYYCVYSALDAEASILIHRNCVSCGIRIRHYVTVCIATMDHDSPYSIY